MHLQSFKTLTQPLPAHRVPFTVLCRRLCIQQAKDFKQKPLHPAELSPRKRKSKYGAKPSKIWHCKELWPLIRQTMLPDGKLMRICARIPTHTEGRLPRSKRLRPDSLHASPTAMFCLARQAALFIPPCTFCTRQSEKGRSPCPQTQIIFADYRCNASHCNVGALPEKEHSAKDALRCGVLPLPGILRPFFKNPI